MRALGALLMALVLVGCVPDPLGRSAAEMRAEKTRCDAQGGTWQPGGMTGAEMCFLENSDAGKACSRGSECSGMCLSESRTCSPVRPLFGCFGMLDETGQEVEICVD